MDNETQLLLKRIDDMISLNDLRKKPQFMGFLDENQRLRCCEYLRGTGFGAYRFFGGYSDAVRCFLCIDCLGEAENGDFPVSCIEFSYRAQDALSHRDFLGSFMALGIKRESVGDIIVEQGRAWAFIDTAVVGYVLTQIEKIGRVGVKTSQIDGTKVQNNQLFEEISGTVTSLRCDCVVALAINTSREKAKTVVQEKKVWLNGFPCVNASKLLSGGDILVIRGRGKFIMGDSGAVTKKGRLHVALKKYL